jgi:hypothetical protein
MALFLALALQAAAPAPNIPAVDFDLARIRGSSRGATASRGEGPEIIVTGRRLPNAYRLPELTDHWRDRPIRAETSLGGGAVARSYLESKEFPAGQISQRIMFGIRMPF